MANEFAVAIRQNQAAFKRRLSDPQVASLVAFCEIVGEHNERLHLTAPSTPEEFVIRHVLESLLLSNYLPKNAKFADVGTGAGFPAIPTLLVRPDLKAILIETKEKKVAFLKEAVERLGLTGRVEIFDHQFSEVDPKECGWVTARALDRFTDRLPALLKWARRRGLVLFAGPSMEDALKLAKVPHKKFLIPMSEQRFIFSILPTPVSGRAASSK